MDLYSFHYLGGCTLNIYELDYQTEKDELKWVCKDFSDWFDFRAVYSCKYVILNIIIDFDYITITVVPK